MRRPPCKDAAGARSGDICTNVRSEVCQSDAIRTTVLMGFPSKIPKIVDAWRSELREKGRAKLASAIASPTEHESLFEEGWTDESSVA